ncbi:MAG: stage II sporulation protein M [Bacillota bacterium]
MGKLVKPGVKGYFAKNYLILLFVAFFLIMGIVFGVLGVKALTPEQLSGLNSYIDTGLKTVGSTLDYQSTAKQAIWRNLSTIFKIWFLGLTVIGLPLILVIIFTRGFILGFTVGFFLQNKGWQGLIIILLTIFPQNIIHLPSLIIAGATSIGFTLYLLRGRKDNTSISSNFIRFSAVMLLIALFMLLAGFLEGYVSLLGTKLFA